MAVLLLWIICVSHAFASVHCCLVVTCWERADLLALVGDVYCIFVTFPCGILGQVWHLIVSFADLCRLSYFTYIKPLFMHPAQIAPIGAIWSGSILFAIIIGYISDSN